MGRGAGWRRVEAGVAGRWAPAAVFVCLQPAASLLDAHSPAGHNARRCARATGSPPTAPRWAATTVSRRRRGRGGLGLPPAGPCTLRAARRLLHSRRCRLPRPHQVSACAPRWRCWTCRPARRCRRSSACSPSVRGRAAAGRGRASPGRLPLAPACRHTVPRPFAAPTPTRLLQTRRRGSRVRGRGRAEAQSGLCVAAARIRPCRRSTATHPPCVPLPGAFGLDGSMLRGRTLLNLDTGKGSAAAGRQRQTSGWVQHPRARPPLTAILPAPAPPHAEEWPAVYVGCAGASRTAQSWEPCMIAGTRAAAGAALPPALRPGHLTLSPACPGACRRRR